MGGVRAIAAAAILLSAATALAASLDKDGEIKLGLRTYVNARVATENTDSVHIPGSVSNPAEPRPAESATFPYSASGHLRQNRYFTEIDLDHSLDRLVKQGFGPLSLLHQLPGDLHGLKYHVTFRAEADTLYDWGPREYRTADQYTTGPFTQPGVNLINNPISGKQVDVLYARRRIRKHSVHRERLFQAYLEGNEGDLFFRIGRQNLSWGEADGFRLLDNINPLDSSFGGFLISIDERRLPLDMVRLDYFLGSVGEWQDAFLEVYAAIDDTVSYVPGPIPGGPWNPPNLDKPSAVVKVEQEAPARTFKNTRGGGRLVWNSYGATFSLAHYYTFLDLPRLRVKVADRFPLQPIDDGYLAVTTLTAKHTQISGGTMTMALPYAWAQAVGLTGEPVLRSEAAYFRGEPRYRQENIDPFIFHQRNCPKDSKSRCNVGGDDTGTSFNLVVGLDINQFIRWINPNQSILISTQFFYKHLFDAAPEKQLEREVYSGEVLPVPNRLAAVVGGAPIEPIFVRNPTDQFLQTLIMTTSYRSGMINPTFVTFYDWGGAVLLQPGVTFSYDPFRFAVDYSFLTAETLKGGSGVSLLRDRDNVQFRFEYVI